VNPKLLVVELWGLGDLLIATAFLRAASQQFAVTLLAKPYALDLQRRFWPGVNVVPFVAPWTRFKGKYHLPAWPWGRLLRLVKQLRAERFAVGLSARWDPRDHALLNLFAARERFGFARAQSQIFLTQALARPHPEAHRYEYWRVLGKALALDLPVPGRMPLPTARRGGMILLHTGAGQPVREWPLENYCCLARRLRERHFAVQIVCDPPQRRWWLDAGEREVATPETVTDLLGLVDRSRLFIGNDSGPGHLAALCGIPTFTIFGPQLPEWFVPLHPAAEWIEGKTCPYKPCSDYCRFPSPHCIKHLAEDEVWPRVEQFVKQC